MKKSIIIIGMMFIMVASVALCFDKMPVITFIPVGGEINDGQEDLPTGIYSINPIFDEQNSDIINIQPSAANQEFLDLLTNGKTNMRTNEIPTKNEIDNVNGVECSDNPDFTGTIITSELTRKICYENEENYGVVLRLFDMEKDLKYINEVAVPQNSEGCFNIEPNHQYLYDIIECSPQTCNCDDFVNSHCQMVDGELKMMRERDCTPDDCAVQEVWVDWVDATIDGCDDYTDSCYETDAGIDYSHYGKTINGAEESTDMCIVDQRLKEYYCSDGEVVSQNHICPSGTMCSNGECIIQENQYQDCGFIDGASREHDDEWCDGVDYKWCNDGDINVTKNHVACAAPTCEYNGMIMEQGDKICMEDGRTVIECAIPENGNEFTYSTCSENKECKPNSKSIQCEQVIISEPGPVSKIWSIWDIFEKLFKRGSN